MNTRRLKYLSVVSALMVFCACSNDRNSELEGRWKLIAVLADPGDGSGTFQPATQEKFLEFGGTNIVVSNESHCLFSNDPEKGKEGTYSVSESRLYFDCESGEESYGFTLINGELILNFPRCIEPCQEKYEKVN